MARRRYTSWQDVANAYRRSYANYRWSFDGSEIHFYNEPTEKEEFILGLCYGEVYNKFPELKLWDYENRIRLDQATKDKVVDFLKQMYNYYLNKYKDYKI